MLTKINFRSVSAVTDFSKVVVGMMDSLKDLETKGDDMVKKISVQESQLASLQQVTLTFITFNSELTNGKNALFTKSPVLKEIKAKEEYIEAVNQKVKESEMLFNGLQVCSLEESLHCIQTWQDTSLGSLIYFTGLLWRRRRCNSWRREGSRPSRRQSARITRSRPRRLKPI